MAYELPDGLAEEILLVFGTVFDEEGAASGYWEQVWEYLVARHNDLLVGTAYPMDWHRSKIADADMRILTSLHKWQTEMVYKYQGRMPYGRG